MIPDVLLSVLLIFISLHIVISLHMSVCLSLHLSPQISLFTCARFEPSHGSVSNAHTEASRADCLSVCLSLLVSYVPLFSLVIFLSFFFSVSCRFSLLLFSMTMTLIPRSIGSLCTHGSDLLCGPSACTLTHIGVVWFVCAVCFCVMSCDVACCHYCRRCAVGYVSVGIDAKAVE